MEKKENLDLVEGRDYIVDEYDRWIFSRSFLLKRGSCCRSGCANCPYGFRGESGVPEELVASDRNERKDDSENLNQYLEYDSLEEFLDDHPKSGKSTHNS